MVGERAHTYFFHTLPTRLSLRVSSDNPILGSIGVTMKQADGKIGKKIGESGSEPDFPTVVKNKTENRPSGGFIVAPIFFRR
jgi:hypothetical protein